MKKILIIALALFTLGTALQAATMAKKDKKEKKELKWEWDGTLSGDTVIDNYLRNIDTLYRNVIEYRETITAYDFRTDTLEINGKHYVLAYMLNKDGNFVTRGTVNWQCAQAVMNAVNIALDMTNASLSSATAALALPGLGLKAFSFGKYVKGGPAVIAQGLKTVKTMRGQWLDNSRTWKDLKKGAIADPSTLNYFDAAALEKLNKCCYLKEIVQTDPTYQAVVESQETKSTEQREADAKAAAELLSKTAIAPEVAGQQADDISDDALMKAMEG